MAKLGHFFTIEYLWYWFLCQFVWACRPQETHFRLNTVLFALIFRNHWRFFSYVCVVICLIFPRYGLGYLWRVVLDSGEVLRSDRISNLSALILRCLLRDDLVQVSATRLQSVQISFNFWSNFWVLSLRIQILTTFEAIWLILAFFIVQIQIILPITIIIWEGQLGHYSSASIIRKSSWWLFRVSFFGKIYFHLCKSLNVWVAFALFLMLSHHTIRKNWILLGMLVPNQILRIFLRFVRVRFKSVSLHLLVARRKIVFVVIFEPCGSFSLLLISFALACQRKVGLIYCTLVQLWRLMVNTFLNFCNLKMLYAFLFWVWIVWRQSILV